MDKKVFMVGDFKSDTGPAIANRALQKALGRRAKYSTKRTKLGRILELFINTIFADVVWFCSFSEINAYGIKLARILRKKTVYQMHGCISLQKELNGTNVDHKRIETEKYIINKVDVLVCVSKLLTQEVFKRFGRNSNVYVLHNIVEPRKGVSTVKKNPLTIMSTGGGMPQKNNLIVCEAIKIINSKLPDHKRIRYIIAGKPYGKENELKKYEFIEFMGEIPHKKCQDLMMESTLYIQNSIFETFGIAVIEAINYGCDVLLSKNIGAREVIRISDNTESLECNSVKDLVNRITSKLFCANQGAKASVNWKKISAKTALENYYTILEKLDEK